MLALQTQFLEATAKAIRGLTLPGAPDVAVRRLPWNDTGDATHFYRGITVHPTTEAVSAGTNLREDIGYGCVVTMIVPASGSVAEDIDKVSQWREAIRRKVVHDAFQDINLEGANHYTTKVVHHQLNVPKEGHRYEISSLLIRCWMRESRT
jgi:hypothetical protein